LLKQLKTTRWAVVRVWFFMIDCILQLVAHYEDVLTNWCEQTEQLLQETDDAREEADNAGPDTELLYWRERIGDRQ
jgi:hypothetical protein